MKRLEQQLLVHCGLVTMCSHHVAMVTVTGNGIKELAYLKGETL